MSGILKGLKGESWERALLIERKRERGDPKLSDDPSNIMLILSNRKDVPALTLAEVKPYLLEQFDLSASDRNIRSAIAMIKDHANGITIRTIMKQYSVSPFPDETGIYNLLTTELFWMPSVSVKIVGEALTRLGYVRNGSKWVRRP